MSLKPRKKFYGRSLSAEDEGEIKYRRSLYLSLKQRKNQNMPRSLSAEDDGQNITIVLYVATEKYIPQVSIPISEAEEENIPHSLSAEDDGRNFTAVLLCSEGEMNTTGL